MADGKGEGGAEDAGWEGQGFKTRLTGEKLLKERAVLQDLPETSVGQAGPSLHGTEVGTLGFHPHPHAPPPSFPQRASNPSRPRAWAEVRREPAGAFGASVALVLDFQLPKP